MDELKQQKLAQKRFVLLFEFSAMYDENEISTEFLKIVIEANFIFDDQALNDGIPSYFYPNSIAIIFPYIRSFVSALSTLANMKPLILPLLNLNALQDVLLQNTEIL